MKIWKEFGSSHSTSVTIIGEFQSNKETLLLKPMIEDLILGHEQGTKDLKEFWGKWESKIPNEFVYLTNSDFNDDPEASLHIEIDNNILQVGGSHLNRFFGIIKLMFAFNAKKIEITGTSN